MLQTTPAVITPAVGNPDEASAMAAMFKAQTANWEETQEKMTQLVSRLRGFLVSCSIPMSHERNFFSLLPFLWQCRV
jgi:protein MPE1